MYPFHSDVAYLTNQDGKMLVINKAGKRLAETQYSLMGEYSGEGLTVVGKIETKNNVDDYFTRGKKTENIYGYVNKDFQCVIQPRFQEAGDFFEMLAPVKESNKWHYIDMTGKSVNSLQFDAATDFRAGVAFVKTQGKYTLINTKFESIQVVAP